MYEVRHYLTPDGKDVFLDWLRKLRDVTAKIAVDRRVNRIELGNFGDHKFCRDGVWELRIDVGPGFRVSRGRRQGNCFVAVRWRQANAGRGYRPCLWLLARLAKEGKR
ncbi:MAG: hypothetical protein OEL20_15815 [Sulfuritalea sp.]|nr:hypothetical protein [Sulfuritalea sp.]